MLGLLLQALPAEEMIVDGGDESCLLKCGPRPLVWVSRELGAQGFRETLNKMCLTPPSSSEAVNIQESWSAFLM